MFCGNHEEDHLVVKIVGVSHMDAMRYVVFLGQCEEVNNV